MFFVLVITGCAGGGAPHSSALPTIAMRGQTARALIADPSGSTASSVITSIEIDAGSTTAVGSWLGDRDYTGGTVASSTKPIDLRKVDDPAPEAVYHTTRYGVGFSYVVGGLAPHEHYEVQLHFVESYFAAAGKRKFSVDLNGNRVLSDYDIYQTAGGENIAIAPAFAAIAADNGTITIAFHATVNNAVIAGIEIYEKTPQPTPTPHPTPTPSGRTICVGGKQYETVQDDEFSADRTLKYTTAQIEATPPPDGVLWSTWQHQPYNYGINDVYYADPTQPYFGGFNPFAIKDGALTVTAEPVPAKYANASVLTFGGYKHHWLSGQLYGPPLSYGYVEVSAEEPNLQGFWPAPLWLVTTNWHAVNDGPPNLVELDANEMFGDDGLVRQTIHFGYNAKISGEQIQTTELMKPAPQKAYHTYGILWTPSASRFYIDRTANSPAYHSVITGPMYPMIDLAVFTKDTWAKPPLVTTPQSMSLQYYRWYQPTATDCKPSVISP
jgi:hypothetical protein